MLRPATENDLDAMRRWRNHPTVRRASFTTHEIRPDEHRRWWSAAQRDPTRRVLIYCHGDVPAGVVAFADLDPDAGTGTWGFYLDVDGLEAAGALLPAWMDLEREAVRYAFDELGLRVLGGETLAWNTPVLQLHRRFGFTAERTYQRDVDGVPQDVVWTELSSDARRH